MKRRSVLLILAAMMASALLFAACGDDDDSDEPEALSKTEFIEQGNEICEQGNAEIDEAARDAFSSRRPTEEEVESFATETLIPSIQGQIDELEALGAPEGDEDQIAEFLDKAQQALDEVEADPSLLAAEDGGDDAFAEVNQLAKDYGLTACAG